MTAYSDSTTPETVLALLDELSTVARLHYADHLPDRGGISVGRLVRDLAATLPAGISEQQRRNADDALRLWGGKEPGGDWSEGGELR